jgi:hypothetical protein
MERLNKSKINGSAVIMLATCLLLSCASNVLMLLDPETRMLPDAQTRGIAPCTNNPPIISTPADIEYTAGQTGHVISWNIDGQGTTTQSYAITRNGTQVASGSWTDPGTVNYNVDGLDAGVYSIAIYASDNAGSVSDEVIVTVNAAVLGTTIDWTVLLVSIAFIGAVALVVIKAVKVVPMSPSKRKGVVL